MVRGDRRKKNKKRNTQAGEDHPFGKIEENEWKRRPMHVKSGEEKQPRTKHTNSGNTRSDEEEKRQASQAKTPQEREREKWPNKK